MIQEKKDLLLKDLCARLPYGVVVKVGDNTYTLKEINTYTGSFGCTCAIPKPYLRSMSSMTEEERKEYREIVEVPDAMDYLLSHHFDCRYLIEEGLAIEVTKENNPYK